jgi:hypothetical protein
MASTFGTWIRSFFGVRGEPAPEAARRFDWDVRPVPERIIAIGDLHGDVRALGALLTECRLIDPAGTWSGGDAHLVLMGDLLGGSDRSRLLLDAVLRLELEAERAGGRVHALLGNHDILPAAGRFGKLTRRERELFTSYPVPGAPGPTLADAFRGDSVYARWLRRRPALLKIGATLFVHAGIEKWAKKHDPVAINDAVSSWVAYWQGVGARPDKASRWMVARQDGEGPLWTRAFKGKAADGPSRKSLRAMLVGYGAKRVVVGHAPTADGMIALEHPRYGDAVILIDTRISDPRRGRMSALEIRGDALGAVYASERGAGRALEELAEARLRGEGTPPPLSLWTRARRWFTGTRLT